MIIKKVTQGTNHEEKIVIYSITLTSIYPKTPKRQLKDTMQTGRSYLQCLEITKD